MSRQLAWTFATVSLLLTAAAVVLQVISHGTPGQPEPFALCEFEPVVAVAFVSMGLLLTLRVPGNTVGWLFSVVGLLSAINASLSGGPPVSPPTVLSSPPPRPASPPATP